MSVTFSSLVSSVISLGCGALGLAWFRRGQVRLWVQVTVTFTLGLAVAILNIFLTANLMFISKDHDLPLLILLMLFAATVSLVLGYALAQALAQRVTALHQGAHALAGGDLAARVDETGGDELAALAAEFNRMAAQLAAAAEERGRRRNQPAQADRGDLARSAHAAGIAALRYDRALADGEWKIQLLPSAT
jgi:HAMP domain-containing protein